MDPGLATIALLVAGIGLLLLAFSDAVITTLAVTEWPGPLTRLLSLTVWRGIRQLTTSSRGLLIRAAGPVVTLTVLTAWIAAAWAGWTLVYAARPEAVVHAQSGEAASFAAKLYFTASTIVTTGPGDFVPSSDLWRVVSGAASISGLALVTLVITYLIPVTSAAVGRMALAQRLSTLGHTPEEILRRHWDGASLQQLGARLDELTAGIVQLRTENLAYPVLHFFHGADAERALAPRLAALDEAVTLVQCGLEAEAGLPAPVVQPWRDAMDTLLDTVVSRVFARPGDEVPPPPSLAGLRAHGFPARSDAQFAECLAGHELRRKRLLAYVRDDAWTWQEVAAHRDED